MSVVTHIAYQAGQDDKVIVEWGMLAVVWVLMREQGVITVHHHLP